MIYREILLVVVEDIYTKGNEAVCTIPPILYDGEELERDEWPIYCCYDIYLYMCVIYLSGKKLQKRSKLSVEVSCR